MTQPGTSYPLRTVYFVDLHQDGSGIDIQQAYTYAERMPDTTSDRPKRKAMFLGPEALQHLATTSARRRTERAAMEEALALLAAQDAQRDAMTDFVNWATTRWGTPTEAEEEIADQIWSSR